VAVLAAVLASVVGCTWAPPATPDGTAAPAPSGLASPAPAGYCRVELPSSWQAAFDAGRFPHAPDEDPSVELTAPDGSMLVHYGRRGSRHEVRWLPAGGEPILVQAFGPEQQEAQVLGAAFDGRYVAYSVTWSLRLFESPWTLYVWDSQQPGEPLEIARSDQDAGGQPVVGR
jgi:hypothetical protein